jgi:hypothetical protein
MKRDTLMKDVKQAADVSYGKYGSYGGYTNYGTYPGGVEKAAKMQQKRDKMMMATVSMDTTMEDTTKNKVAEQNMDMMMNSEAKRHMMHPDAEEMSGSMAKVNKLPDNWYGRYK